MYILSFTDKSTNYSIIYHLLQIVDLSVNFVGLAYEIDRTISFLGFL